MSPRRGLVRGTLTYLRRDLREIVAPTSLPDDDDFTARNGNDDDGNEDARRRRHRNRLGGRLRAIASGIQDYCDTWKKTPEPLSIGADQSTGNKTKLEGNDDVDAAADRLETNAALREAASDARDALASASRAGAEALRPALRQLYRTRAAAYRDAVFSFVEGYREGLAGGSGGGREKDGDDDDDENGDNEKKRFPS